MTADMALGNFWVELHAIALLLALEFWGLGTRWD